MPKENVIAPAGGCHASIESWMCRVSLIFDFDNQADADKFYDTLVSAKLDRQRLVMTLASFNIGIDFGK